MKVDLNIETRFLQYEFEKRQSHRELIGVSGGVSFWGISKHFCEWLNTHMEDEKFRSTNPYENQDFLQFATKKAIEEEAQKEMLQDITRVFGSLGKD